MPLKIRDFTVKDARTLAGMLAKIAKNSGLRQIMRVGANTSAAPSAATQEQQDEQNGALISAVLAECYAAAEADMFAWFASLIGKTPEELDAMGASTIIEIIEAVVDKKESKDFFLSASALFKKINGLLPSTKSD